MSIWSAIAKIGGYVAAPFTGGLSIPISQAGAGIIDKLGTTTGEMSKAAKEGNLTRDNQRILQERAQLDRDKFALLAPEQRMSQSTRASLLSHVAPQTVKWGGPGSGLRGEVPTYSGGATDALAHLSGDVGPLASTILAQNLHSQQANKDANSKYINDIGKSSVTDKILGGTSTGLNILKDFLKPKAPVEAPSSIDETGLRKNPFVLTDEDLIMDDPRKGGITGTLPRY